MKNRAKLPLTSSLILSIIISRCVAYCVIPIGKLHFFVFGGEGYELKR